MTTDRDELDRTPPWYPTDTVGVPPARPPEAGRQIGRYLLEGVLGEGTYGRVHLARHEVLGRRVAVKVLHRRHGSRGQEIRAFLNEALLLAHLDHPGIVPVHDAGWTEDGLYYLVSRYIEGGDLGAILRRRQFAHRESAALIEAVAEAVDFAHTRGLVHRDIKPANILLEATGQPCLADFGGALRDRDFGRGARFTGTPAYMSPEQARGEGHRVDGRSDIFSLGVVFYELLTGRRPFRGETREDLSEQIVAVEAQPPRQINASIPDALERVCLRALAKRATERYPTAGAMAEDLRAYLRDDPAVEGSIRVVVPGRAPPEAPGPLSTRGVTMISAIAGSLGPGSSPNKIIPKGLRPYDARDADFFPDLLPGPRDRGGLPESIAFWKARIEGPDGPDLLRVGLIFGPSGCGKTSLVRAGLLPRLCGRLSPIYIEATARETEARLLGQLRRRCPDLSQGLGLAETLVEIRKGRGTPSGQKVLIVLDQFERWLHARSSRDEGLIAALRQCDGEHALALVVVREDSWLGASRFMRDLGDRIIEGGNSTAVDPFDLPHARRVLEAFGMAYDALPEGLVDLSEDQELFLDRAIAGLVEGDRILPIRLVLLAETVKGKAWSPAALEAVPVQRDMGVTLLEQTFDAEAAPPEDRNHRRAARRVLMALMPEAGPRPTAPGRSYRELLAASGHARRPAVLDDLLKILDDRLHLITPIDPETSEGEAKAGPTGFHEQCYRLTHDYLVTPLREWLAFERGVTQRDGEESLRANRPEGTRDDGLPIDINTASRKELEELSGVGPAIARRIIEGRPYGSVDDLQRVKGIGAEKLEEIRPYVTAR